MVRYETPTSSSGYSVEREAEAQAWIEEVTERPFKADFGEELRDGRRLCELMNAIKPGLIRRINNSTIPFKQMENVSNFIKGCRTVGVPEYSLFETVDLFELKDLGIVVKCLHALGGAAQANCPEFRGPHLGLKAAPKTSPSQKRHPTMTSSFSKPTVSRGASGINAPSAPGPKQVSPPRQASPAQLAYPTRDEPPPPAFEASAPPTAPVGRSDTAKSPPPPFDESATAWSGGGEPQLPPPPPYQEKSSDAGPSIGGITATELEDVMPQFSQALRVADSPPNREPSKNRARYQGFSASTQNGTKSPALPRKPAEVHRQADPGPKSTPYYSSSASTATAQSFSPGAQTASLSPQSDVSSVTSRPAPVTVARGGGFGLDAELAQKREANYDYQAEKEAQDWIEAVTGEPFSEEFGEELRNGRRLCLLINAIKPGAVRKVNDSRMPFKQMENISNFLKACRTVGVAEHSLFETVDLFEGKDLGLVVRCVHALGQTIQTTCPEFNGPRLGIKQTEANKREWTPEEQQRQALYSAGTMSHVMAGSSKTMERGTIVKEGVTFGAATCGVGDTSVVARWTMGSQPTMERLTVSKSGPTFGAEYAGKADPHCSSSMFTRGYN